MSDDQNETIEELTGQLTALQEQLTTSATENESMKEKMGTLLDETKAAKKKVKEAEDAARIAADMKAKDDGNFEQLYQSSEEARKGLEAQLADVNTKVATKERDQSATSIATELADGYNVALLSEHIAKRLKYTDEGLKVVDEAGNLTVTTIDDLKTEFQGNKRFASLLKGSQASGGDATGGNGADGGAKVMSRADFDKQTPESKMKFIKGGGAVTI